MVSGGFSWTHVADHGRPNGFAFVLVHVEILDVRNADSSVQQTTCTYS